MDQKIILINTSDPKSLSGGNLYNRHIAQACSALGINFELLFISDKETSIDIDTKAIYLIDSLVICGALDFDIFSKVPAYVLLHMCPSMDISLSALEKERISTKEQRIFHHFSIISAGQNNLNYIKAQYNLIPPRVNVIPPGIDESFQQKKSYPSLPSKLVSFGSILPAKGLMRTLKVLNYCKSYDWQWHHYGSLKDESHYDALNNFAKKENINGRIHFHGAIDHQRVNAKMLTFDLLLHLSDYENNSMVIREAIGSGLPFVSTPVGDMDYLKYEGAGHFTSSLDSAEIAAELKEYFKDPIQYNRLIEMNQHLEILSWNQSAQALIQFLAET